jgi:hypothetical protein
MLASSSKHSVQKDMTFDKYDGVWVAGRGTGYIDLMKTDKDSYTKQADSCVVKKV